MTRLRYDSVHKAGCESRYGAGSRVRTVPSIVIRPLGIQDIVHGHHVVVFVKCSAAHPSQLLHMPSNTKQQSHMYAKRPDVRAGFAGDPEHGEIPLLIDLQKFRLVDGTDTELTLDSRNQRRPLEKSTSHGLNGPGKRSGVLQG